MAEDRVTSRRYNAAARAAVDTEQFDYMGKNFGA
jgi:hypothetical protein